MTLPYLSLVTGDAPGSTGPWSCQAGPPAVWLLGRGDELFLIAGPAGDRGWLALLTALDPGPPQEPYHRVARIARRLPELVRHEGPAPDGRRFVGGFAGAFAWELGRRFEPTMGGPEPGDPWDFALGLWDRVEGRRGLLRTMDRLRADGAAPAPEEALAEADGTGPALLRGALTPDLDADAHRTAVATIRDLIAAGTIYQANLTLRLRGEASGAEGAWAAWGRLLRQNPSPYAAWMRLPGVTMIGASPEAFLSLDNERRVLSRPIKGTRRRGLDVDSGRLDLESSAKDAAELAMIIDLVRNDLARSCEPGTITRTDRIVTEAHPTVWHRVGEVEGRLRSNQDAWDLLRGAFPPGSCIGAPKIRAASVLESLERGPRFLYTGAAGWMGWDGSASLSVVIRTILVRGSQVEIGVGGGIVWDSDPQAEWDEAMIKARALVEAAG